MVCDVLEHAMSSVVEDEPVDEAVDAHAHAHALQCMYGPSRCQALATLSVVTLPMWNVVHSVGLCCEQGCRLDEQAV